MIAYKKIMKKVIIIVATAIVVALAGGTIWVNVRFPQAKVEIYTKDNCMEIEELRISPVNYKIYTPNEFYNLYPDNTHFEHLKERDGYDKKNWMIVYTVEISNLSNEARQFKVHLLEAEASESKWFNGLTRVDEKYNSIYEAGTVETVELVALLSTSQIQYKYIDNVENDNYFLNATYYPIQRKLFFERG